jgi:hypothetical protein
LADSVCGVELPHNGLAVRRRISLHAACQVTLKDSLPGAFLGGLLWEIAKYVFALSLNYFHMIRSMVIQSCAVAA